MPELHARSISFALGIASNMHFGSLHSVLAAISTDACSAHSLQIGSPASAKPIAGAKAVLIHSEETLGRRRHLMSA